MGYVPSASARLCALMPLSRLARCVALLACLCASVASAQPSPDEVLVGPITVPQTINGVTLDLPVLSYLRLATIDGRLYLRARTLVDLRPLQASVGPLVDGFAFPTDSCATLGGKNPVVHVWGKQLAVSGNALVLTLTGDAERWDCRGNPVANSRLEWTTDNQLGIPVPHLALGPGEPVKNRLLKQPFTAALPATLRVATPQSVAIDLGTPNVQLGGQFGGVTANLLTLAGIDVSARAQEALRSAMGPALLEHALPEEFAKLLPQIGTARFIELAGAPAAAFELSAVVPPESITAFIRVLLNQSASAKPTSTSP